MRFSVQSTFSRALALLGMVGLGFAQVGCAHPVMVEPSVSVHSSIGHFPVYAQVGVPGPVIYAPPPRVIYAPPPPPRVIYAPQVYGQANHWRPGHERRHWDHERRHPKYGDAGHGPGNRGPRDDWRR